MNFFSHIYALLGAAPAAESAVTSGAEGTQSTGSIWSTVILFGVLIVAMYFIMIRPQKKREKEQKMMRDALAIGDEIVTIGGIAGIVVNIRDDSVVIETGSDRDKIKIMKWAIQTISQMRDTSAESKPEPKSTETPATSSSTETVNALEEEKKEKRDKKNKGVE